MALWSCVECSECVRLRVFVRVPLFVPVYIKSLAHECFCKCFWLFVSVCLWYKLYQSFSKSEIFCGRSQSLHIMRSCSLRQIEGDMRCMQTARLWEQIYTMLTWLDCVCSSQCLHVYSASNRPDDSSVWPLLAAGLYFCNPCSAHRSAGKKAKWNMQTLGHLRTTNSGDMSNCTLNSKIFSPAILFFHPLILSQQQY